MFSISVPTLQVCAEITLVYFVVLMQIKNEISEKYEKRGFGEYTEFFLTSTDSRRNI